MKKLKIYTDGGARGNPGPAGCGVVIIDENNKIVARYKKYLGEQTNNFAEYSAVILALAEAKKMPLCQGLEIEVLMDSELAVKQLNREYKVKNQELAKLFVKIYNLQHSFKRVSFSHVPREMNRQADLLVNQVIDEAMK
ncbi:ribonuclease H [Candidatus Kuenenbacteria bacterium CG_4_9_14_3_um_filter_39_14]|uniref:Ribonuclease H n=6 Tax=Candidatus Kueneniibacteriota TaxID=1752740 RepID=A0A2M7ILF3_9BACT|nr:MAG: ribonuclease H [Candidatus Kuenenbacteria bacterium CG23_combo_of_CG06-09_8_20_14_all_39_39]PIP76020.1 MAG: ribonuclease H [Candidatus Kuenenbacteria bacterium CG22_combo_CG10-13_8_21_14_all_39_9]PIR80971.1 MAG: ribonuclease H [Candidatus Kuenenbacteria bacterium CG10_big_fil_rev_8_21_14_0_10_39_14]PIW95631.1 MAG: ribonuclease H [Candidatus Kuenenbacteria bacterium CG_4_8_14_3_um_filter_39_15]PIX92141.1 MAG: ribonuclease H [Candidatus Kuenenbacteria bacterium CG_4_10_14_3_um_filter_39_1